MENNELKRFIEVMECHLHKRHQIVTINEKGKLELKTCCNLFRNEIYLMVPNEDIDKLEDFEGVA